MSHPRTQKFFIFTMFALLALLPLSAQTQMAFSVPSVQGTGTSGPIITSGQTQAPAFAARTLRDLGHKVEYETDWPNYNFDWDLTRSRQWTNIHATQDSGQKKVATKFLTEAAGTTVVVDFSATVYVSQPNARSFLRILIDGQVMEPSDVMMTRGAEPVSTSFSFATTVARGLHVVEAQWLVDPGATAYMRDAAILVRQSGVANLVAKIPDSGPSVTTASAGFVDVPDLSASIWGAAGKSLTMTVAAESWVNASNVSMFLRVLVDGVAVKPADVVFASNTRSGSRAMTFGTTFTQTKNHDIRVQWAVTNRGTAGMGDRALILDLASAGEAIGRAFASPLSGPTLVKNGAAYTEIPGLSLSGFVPDNGEIVVTFSAELFADPGVSVKAALTVDGTVMADQPVTLRRGGLDGVQHFIFQAKHFNTADGPAGNHVTIGVAWSSDGQAYIGDRSVSLLAKNGDVPDLSRSPLSGSGNQYIEPILGNIPVLTILWDPHRENHPAPSTNDIENALFAGADNADKYWAAMSGGKVSLSNEGIYSTDAEEDADYYWDSEFNDPFWKGGHARAWAEAINAAAAQTDLSSYDTNQDGVLSALELAIVIVKPQTGTAGFVRAMRPYKSEDSFVADGVVIPQILEWYTSDPEKDRHVLYHEMGHLLFRLGDLYWKSGSASIGMPSDPGSLSLMSGANANYSELDAHHRISLGWMTPWNVKQTSTVFVEDAETSLNAYVLPRNQGGDGKEYFLMEYRSNEPTPGELGFPPAWTLDGVAVWHVVEGGDAQLETPCLANNPTFLNAWNAANGDMARQSLRLIRPSGIFNNSQLWDAGAYELGDGPLVCPGEDPAVMVLDWADGIPSGYRLNWTEFAISTSTGLNTNVEVP